MIKLLSYFGVKITDNGTYIDCFTSITLFKLLSKENKNIKTKNKIQRKLYYLSSYAYKG